MLASTTFAVDGHQIVEYRGVVRGIVVRTPTISQGIVGGLKSIVGGHIGYDIRPSKRRSTASNRRSIASNR